METENRIDFRMEKKYLKMVLGLSAALILLGIGGFWFYHSQKKSAFQGALTRVEQIGNHQATAVSQWRRIQLEDAGKTMKTPFFTGELIRFLTHPREADAHLLKTRLASLRSGFHYSEMWVLDSRGHVRLGRSLSTESRESLTAAAQESFDRRQPVIARMHRCGGDAKPCVSVVAPVFGQDPASVLPDFQPLGAVVLAREADATLYPLLQTWPEPSATAETLLIRRDDEDVVFLSHLALYPDTALKVRVPLNREDVLVAVAGTGRQGVVQAKDYRGEDVVAALLPVPDSPWLLVAKQDAAELFAQWRKRAFFLKILFAAVAGMIVIAGVMVLQVHKTALYRHLYQTEARLRREAKQYSEALKESERSKSVLIANLPAMVYRCAHDPDRTMQFVSEKCRSLTGYSPEDLMNSHTVSYGALILSEDRPKVADAWARAVADHSPAKIEYRIITADHLEKWVYEQGMPVYGATGRIEALEGIVMDISDRRQAEQEKADLGVQLIQAQKMESVGRLAGGVAHDYNNMLNVILGYAEMALAELERSDPLYGRLEKIHHAAARSAEITRQLLAFARKQTIAPRYLDLNETVENGVLPVLSRLMGENIDLVWRPGPDPGPVKMDPAQIDQILVNLCVNARDAIEDVGKITIETGQTTFDSAYCEDRPGFVPGDFVLLAVSDNGCGMDRAVVKQIFEPFFTTKKADIGTGMGLATVYGIVKQNSGFINVYSEPGKGTTMKVYLVRHSAPRGLGTKVKKLPKDVSGHGETILVVEDETDILELIKSMLEQMAYRVLTAASPSEALALARGHAEPIDLLITDVILPEMNGRDLNRHLASLFPDLKVMFMSGYTANVIAHHGVLENGVQFIQKPFSRKDLAEKVKEILMSGT